MTLPSHLLASINIQDASRVQGRDIFAKAPCLNFSPSTLPLVLVWYSELTGRLIRTSLGEKFAGYNTTPESAQLDPPRSLLREMLSEAEFSGAYRDCR
jgi:hypothetical protein